MKSKAYRAVNVNQIDAKSWIQDRDETTVHAGLDVGKESIYCTLRWGVNDFDRPWRAGNPEDVGRLATLLSEVGRGRQLIVALEPTGTYGDAMRQALEGAAVTVHRVSPKSASDYAEIFDGVPSQHDGKDAAVVAELSAQGKSWPWPLPTPTEAEQELAYHVEGMDAHRRQMTLWYGQLEALLSRHWPEATRVLPLRTATLWHCLMEYGGRGWRGPRAKLGWVVPVVGQSPGVGGERAAHGRREDGTVGPRTCPALCAGDAALSGGSP